MEHIDEIGRDFDVYQFYGTVPRAMYTLFETCIEPLNIRPVIERQPWMVGFFFIFIFISTFGVLNVIIGVIVEHTMSTSEENKNAAKVRQFEEKMDKLEIVRDSCFGMDDDGNLTLQQIQKAFEMPLVLDTMEEVELPLGLQPEELFNLLDADGNGKVSYEQMMMELTRATVHNEHQQLLDLKIGLHTTQRQIQHIVSTLAELQNQMKYGFCQIVPEEKMQSWPTRSDLPSNVIPPQMPQTDVGNADEKECSGLCQDPPTTLCQSLQTPQSNVGNADELECSGISESAEDTTNGKSGPDTGKARCGPDEKCFQSAKIQDKASIAPQEPLQMPCVPENDTLAHRDGQEEKASKRTEDISPSGQSVDPASKCLVKPPAPPGPPGHPCQPSTSSMQPPPEPPQARKFSNAATEEPAPLLMSSDVEGPPHPPNTKERVPAKSLGPGLHQPCDDSAGEVDLLQ